MTRQWMTMLAVVLVASASSFVAGHKHRNTKAEPPCEVVQVNGWWYATRVGYGHVATQETRAEALRVCRGLSLGGAR